MAFDGITVSNIAFELNNKLAGPSLGFSTTFF